MVYLLPSRFFHTSKICLGVVPKAVLSELRKRTGYSFANCKKALLENNNDVQKAETWLDEEAQKQGWLKVAKLGKAISQGLVAIKSKDRVATMIEVNCETDFVARNSQFSDLVSTVLSACYTHTATTDIGEKVVAKWELNSGDIGNLPWENKTLSDCVALCIGKFGEGIILRRAVCLKAARGIHINGYTHPPTSTGQLMGKYGALVAFKKLDPHSPLHNHVSLEEFGRQLSQHVVGMNPKTLNSEEEPNKNEEEETCMMHQEFLIDPEVTVSEVLIEGTVEILDFSRYECGERLEHKADCPCNTPVNNFKEIKEPCGS